jgi:cell division protein FtsL
MWQQPTKQEPIKTTNNKKLNKETKGIMKRVIIAAALVFVAGFVSVYTKQVRVQNTNNTVKVTFFNYQKELASGD